MKEFTDLLKKKASEQGEIKPGHLEAKAAAVKNLMDEMEKAMGSEMHDGLKKVTVASDSKKGLEKGLDLAKKVAKGEANGPKPEGVEDLDPEELMESPEEEASESEADEAQESDEDRKVAELHRQIAEIQSKKKPSPSN